jgi:tetrahydromethanopterin S-methyltransferase subunit B
MGDHTAMREPNAFFRGCLYGFILMALVALIVGFYFVVTGAFS